MIIEFDPAKDAANIAKHGLSLADAARFDFDRATIVVDGRFDYGEMRFRAFERIGRRGYCLVFTIVGIRLRAISLRYARDKEMRRYE